jgi:hypothetical protein
MLKTIKMNKIIILLILTAQLGSCQKKMENYKTEKFEWDGDATAPEGYPMFIISPNFFMLHDDKLAFIPNMGYTDYGWSGSARSWSLGELNKTMPESLHIAWLSITENKFYEGNFKMPQEKLHKLFKEGYMIYSIPIVNDDGKALLHHETFNAITVGLAPKGMVVVWASGQNKVEIGRYQAQEVDKVESNRMWKHFFKGVGGIDPGDMPSQIPNKELETFLPHVQQEIKEGKISSKQWDDYRLRYNWKIECNQPFEIYKCYVEFFNSEYISYPTTNDQALFNKIILESQSKAVPKMLGMYVTTQDGVNRLIRVEPFHEQETIEAFKKMHEASPDKPITMFFDIDAGFTTAKITLKNDKKEILLEKDTIKLFKLDESNDRKNEK